MSRIAAEDFSVLVRRRRLVIHRGRVHLLH